MVRLDGLAGDGEVFEGDNVFGTVEVVRGTSAADQIVGPQAGQAGAVRGIALDGREGNDVLVGSPGPDDLAGGGGDDRILGGDGPDLIIGGPGVDALDGGASGDLIESRDAAVDRIECGAG